jgi:hypothetical protein
MRYYPLSIDVRINAASIADQKWMRPEFVVRMPPPPLSSAEKYSQPRARSLNLVWSQFSQTAGQGSRWRLLSTKTLDDSALIQY